MALPPDLFARREEGLVGFEKDLLVLGCCVGCFGY
jgi:hypothetical protein